MRRAGWVFAVLVLVVAAGCSPSSDESTASSTTKQAANAAPLSLAPPADTPKYLAKLSAALDASALLGEDRGVFGRVGRVSESSFRLAVYPTPSGSGDVKTIPVLPQGLRNADRIVVTVSGSTRFAPKSASAAGLSGHDVFVGGRFSTRSLEAEAIADLGEGVDNTPIQSGTNVAAHAPELLNFNLGLMKRPSLRLQAERVAESGVPAVEEVASLRFDYRSPRVPSVNLGGALQFGPSCPRIRAEAKVIADAHEEAHFAFKIQRTEGGFALLPANPGPFASEDSYPNPQAHPDKTTFYSGYGVGLALKFSISCSVWGFKKSFDFTLAEITALMSSYTHQPPPLSGARLVVPTNDCLVLKSKDYGPFRALSHIPKLNKYANLEIPFCIPITVLGSPVAYHMDDRAQAEPLVALPQGTSVRLDSFSYAPRVKRSVRLGIAVGTSIARGKLPSWADGSTSIGFDFPPLPLFTESLGPLRITTQAEVSPLPTTTTTTTTTTTPRVVVPAAMLGTWSDTFTPDGAFYITFNENGTGELRGRAYPPCSSDPRITPRDPYCHDATDDYPRYVRFVVDGPQGDGVRAHTTDRNIDPQNPLLADNFLARYDGDNRTLTIVNTGDAKIVTLVFAK